MRIHFIAIGGSAMHNLAIALVKKGDVITGSDDEIFEPSKSRLAAYGILPPSPGWDETRIHAGLDAVVLGMQLLKARSLGLKIYSYPEYLYEHAKNKKRIVIGGSHGKTTITSIILHVLKYYSIPCDYMVGAQLEGFDVMVSLSDSAPYIVLEGDEYLTSALDRRPKFHVYRPDVALISGIAWDHINVFPTFDIYVEQFRTFIDLIPPGGTLVYCADDPILKELCPSAKQDIIKRPYTLPEFTISDGITSLIYKGKAYPIQLFGRHNLLNINGARLICHELGVTDAMFYEAVTSFKGATKRLELVTVNATTAFYRDFAHAPSKLKATIDALKEQYPGRTLVACMELHTYSSLNTVFLPHYHGTMDKADIAMVYYNPHVLSLKRLPDLSPDGVHDAFAHRNMKVYTDSGIIVNDLHNMHWEGKNLLMMSSGDFDGMDMKKLACEIVRPASL
jgi:UDP-N-acetylmuramate: L-alanyl-gamma-D-glutamyl-meso-diaminopimelate ligase